MQNTSEPLVFVWWVDQNTVQYTKVAAFTIVLESRNRCFHWLLSIVYRIILGFFCLPCLDIEKYGTVIGPGQ